MRRAAELQRQLSHERLKAVPMHIPAALNPSSNTLGTAPLHHLSGLQASIERLVAFTCSAGSVFS